MPISQRFLQLQENKYHFLQVPLFFIEDAKNHRNRLNLLFGKTQIKNITNTHTNRFGPPERFLYLLSKGPPAFTKSYP